MNKNIQKYRKAMNLTQEQLAEAMGVTTGAVSKWENGLANPDIGIIAELADFFEISVDVLLGYDWKKKSMGQMAERIKSLNEQKKFEEAISEAQKALQKYPNSFDIIYNSGDMYANAGLESDDEEKIRIAMKLLDRAGELIDRNNDPKLNYESIQIKIGTLYAVLGDFDQAIEKHKKYNIEGICNDKIGQWLVNQEKFEEAIPVLSESFLNCILKLFISTIQLSGALGNLKRWKEASEMLGWLKVVFLGLINDKKGGYPLKILSLVCLQESIMYSCDSQMEKAYQSLNAAVDYARKFDKDPKDNAQNFRFYLGKEQTLYDDIGAKAMDRIEKTIVNGIKDEPNQELLIQYFNKILKGE